jgi:hypothetical protein
MSNSSTSKGFAALIRFCTSYFPNTVLDNQCVAHSSVPTLEHLQDCAKPQLRGIIENLGALAQRYYRGLTLALYIVAIERS